MRWCRRSLSIVVGIGLLLAALILAVQFVGVGAIGQERLQAAAQKALTSFAGFAVKADMEELRLVLSDRSLVALEVRKLDLDRAETGDTLIEADALRFGFKLWPLLSGRIEVGSVEIEGARIDLARLSNRSETSPDDPFWARPVEPGMLPQHVFSGLRRAYAAAERAGTRYITLRDVELVAADNPTRRATVDLRASVAPAGKLDFDGTVHVGGRAVAVTGQALRPVRDGPIRSLSVALELPRAGFLDAAIGGRDDGAERGQKLGALRLSLEGAETEAGKGSLALDLRFEDAAIGLGEDGTLSATGNLSAKVDDAADAITISRANLSVGRSLFNFVGSLGLQDRDGEGPPIYSFDLMSRRSIVAAADSPEADVSFAARVTGRIEPAGGRIVGDAVRIVTAAGQVSASAAVTLEAGKSPGLSLAVYASDLPTNEVKQFWPWFAAPGARNWVLSNLFGGRVTEGNLRLRVPPGRLGNGQPLDNDEVSGEFRVANARFDIAGHIPPVRDGIGMVKFQGADVDVFIDSGTVYMPSGRTVAASQGTLKIRNAHIRPRIGKLEIDVAGEAPAVVELASYEPIDVSSVIGLKPKEVSGDVKAHVAADIPLSNGIPRDMLRWRVALDYENLSLSKPFDGQTITDAKGVAVIEPEKADISASAKLNGVPAKLDLVEPLGQNKAQKRRNVTLTLDDKARRRILPGLDDIVAGTSEVRYEELENGLRKISVKLDAAELMLPWMNWRKGTGIPASASFVMEQKENEIALRDFNLEGQTFAASGRLTIANGELAFARFDGARLNRGDDFTITIERKAKAYAISMRGAAFDARSVIKQYLGTQADAGDAGGGGSVGVELNAKLTRLSGFSGEVLRDVSLTYVSDGRSSGRLETSATTHNGGTMTLSRNGGTIGANSNDAGAIMRFLDFYPNMEGGQMRVALRENGRTLSGSVAAQDFFIVNEPRLRSLVAATETGDDSQVDVSRVRFDRGYANIHKSGGSLELQNGVLRGPLIGTTFQGLLFDENDNISITGTFMPLYGLNRIFGEIPLFGEILGNGRDRGLIGITYRLMGKLDSPQLEVNPISAIAPGIFRQIFEYR
ncbi:DUF3971 domain-containing protein [Nitratireductor sp. ZSWI3]|uniref:YhdP family protein n=1 Tax=Nitratireductor sp. ZSWI3 TaxID=2966359 RepID=UPI00215032AC|nr:DUF3971 domain-containing protein [Nitratireductor sp. ZSWI3]MCR4266491.1 hypothetical protein [Nitratireductor sp. ZSWI3]